MSSVKHVRGMYKQLLVLAKGLPPREYLAARSEIRDKFRILLADDSDEGFEELVKFHRNKVGYYKIVTPKKPSAGHEKFVFKGGKLVEGSVEVNGRVQRAGYDSDDIARHYHLMQRQHFMHRR
uniref:Uncharacterized protein n=1 Tax=Mucochytrium quahogii TaxID=96639 RepID=A0A7S2RB78_9STRA|mmetsp:Transcript_5428/g.8408  ORF Transcript_5428/g.8408 Transcript_5428/m.8408 type:complete len:123 (-) Transcript_5428:87-455(-)